VTDKQADQNKDFPAATMKPLAAAAALAQAGFPENQWATGVAVGMGESSLNIAARNHSSDSVGWLQINKKAHPELFKGLKTGYEWLSPDVNAQFAKKVYDKAHGWGPWEAYTGSDGSGSDGSYRKYLSTGESAAAELKKNLAGKSAADQKAYLQSLTKPYDEVAALYYIGIGSQAVGTAIGDAGEKAGNLTVSSGAAVASAVSDLVKEFTAISDLFQALLLPSTWIRVGAGAVGVMLIVGGMVALGKEASSTSS
jgi:hypothetical protein